MEAVYLYPGRRPALGRAEVTLTIDPAAANTAAIRSYERVGFRPVGVMHAYERDANGDRWHDGLLMELVVEAR